MSEFDFSQVEKPKSEGYLKPGWHVLHVVGAKYEKPEGKKPFIAVEFNNDGGDKLINKFYLSPGALPNLKYFHEGWWGKPLEKVFKSAEEVAAYFEKMCAAPQTKVIKKRVEVSGSQSSNGKVYGELAFGGFIIDEKMDFFKEGDFEEGSANYKRVVRVQFPQTANPSTQNDDVMLPATVDQSYKDDLPWDD